MNHPKLIEDEGFRRDLEVDERLEVQSAMRPRRVTRGETLIEQGASAESLFIVNFGLFEVRDALDDRVFGEIVAGQFIGEIGFFADERRSASVVAARDSEVLEINKAEFDALAARVPKIQRAVTRSLAKRLVARFNQFERIL